MDKLWAPWRLAYIKKINKDKGCLFCRVFKSKNDKNNLVFLRSKHSFAMLNLYPYNNGHVMVAPVKHIKSMELLTNDEILDCMNTLNRVKRALENILKPQGYNIGMNIGRIAGAGIEDHMHIHIVPRWQGDTNFMPVVFQAKVISQSLKTLYTELIKQAL